MRSTREDDGQAVPLVAALVAIGAVLALAMGTLAGDVVDAGRARSAADAAALAGAHGGAGAAARLAIANGATLVSWRRDGADVEVTVRVGAASATARATAGG
ncbi:MAG: TadE-like protein [Ilumatobacteraceae bacterium]